MKPQCKQCGEEFSTQRFLALKQHRLPCLCTTCGDQRARQHKHTIVPLHKSNYVCITDLEMLKGINSKGGWYR